MRRAFVSWGIALACAALGGSSAACGGATQPGEVVDAVADTGTVDAARMEVGLDAADAADAADADAGLCAAGSVTFRMEATGGAWSVYGGGGDPGCDWLTVTSAATSSVALNAAYPPPGLDLDCRDCTSSWPIPIGCARYGADLVGAPLEKRWDGSYDAPGSCGAPARGCVTPSCAPSGSYLARMCACPGDFGAACASPTCVDVPFDYPTAAPVVGLLATPH